jgi:hypothetical protein
MRIVGGDCWIPAKTLTLSGSDGRETVSFREIVFIFETLGFHFGPVNLAMQLALSTGEC